MQELRLSACLHVLFLLATACGSGASPGCGTESATPVSLVQAPPPAYVVQGLADLVDTRRGTHAFRGTAPLVSRGNTFPATAVPFGFNFWTPVTYADSATWLYNFQRPVMTAFAISHEPSTWMGDYGMFHIWPMVGAPTPHVEARAVPFSHANEIARPYHYAVRLDNGVQVEIAPTDHGAIFSMGFPPGPAYVLFDTVRGSGGSFAFDLAENAIDATVTTGSVLAGVRTMYVAMSFDNATLSNMQQATERTLASYVSVAPAAAGPVILRVATSWIGAEQARENLAQEVAHRTFDEVRNAAKAAWDAELSRIQITGTNDEKTIFYSNLYRAYLYPNNRTEIHDGQPRYQSPYNNEIVAGSTWVNNGFWDTYRSEWPLLVLTRPTETGAMLNGFAHAYLEGGWTPRWTSPGYANLMTGTHTDVVFADAYSKGVRNFDVEAAYASALQNATTAAPDAKLGQGRNGLHRATFLDYTPADVEKESVAWHLEGCVNDFAIAQMAHALGRNDDAAYLLERAKTYVNLFSREVGFFRGRNADGAWRTRDKDFNPADWAQEFTEGNAWHYAFAASFDVQGMANLYGGRENLARKIDAMFAASPKNITTYYDSIIHEMQEAEACNMGQYGHSNEPVHHVPYLYNYVSQPWKTQARVRHVLDPNNGLYTLGTQDGSGWLGDEDNGQMSAWFIFSALGFYPAMGAMPEYLLGSPLYTSSTLHLENGKQFTVSAPNNSAANIYVQRATLNGTPLLRAYLTHDEIVAGGTLLLEMGPQPSSWGADPNLVPHSMTQGTAPPVPMRDHAQGGTPFTYATTLSPHQDAQAAFDNDSRTAWAVRGGTGILGYTFKKGGAAPLVWYTVTSGLDDAKCDPVAWTLEGSTDGTHWTTLDKRDNQHFTKRLQTQMYRAAVTTPQQSYRLAFKTNNSECLQVGEVEFVSPS